MLNSHFWIALLLGRFAAVAAVLAGYSYEQEKLILGCRAQCLNKYLTPANFSLTACKNGQPDCRICWETCDLFYTEHETWAPMCDLQDDICLPGCRLSCSFFHSTRVLKNLTSSWSIYSQIHVEHSDDLCSLTWQRPRAKSRRHSQDTILYGVMLRDTDQKYPEWGALMHTLDAQVVVENSVIEPYEEMVVIAVTPAGLIAELFFELRADVKKFLEEHHLTDQVDSALVRTGSEIFLSTKVTANFSGDFSLELYSVDHPNGSTLVYNETSYVDNSSVHRFVVGPIRYNKSYQVVIKKRPSSDGDHSHQRFLTLYDERLVATCVQILSDDLHCGDPFGNSSGAANEMASFWAALITSLVVVILLVIGGVLMMKRRKESGSRSGSKTKRSECGGSAVQKSEIFHVSGSTSEPNAVSLSVQVGTGDVRARSSSSVSSPGLYNAPAHFVSRAAATQTSVRRPPPRTRDAATSISVAPASPATPAPVSIISQTFSSAQVYKTRLSRRLSTTPSTEDLLAPQLELPGEDDVFEPDDKLPSAAKLAIRRLKSSMDFPF